LLLLLLLRPLLLLLLLPPLQLVEGATLLLGAAACLLVSLGPLWVRAPSLGLALLAGLMLSGMEGFLTGEAVNAGSSACDDVIVVVWRIER
jgi:hypothetical protein